MCKFCIFPAHGKICLKWPRRGQEFFPTNPDLADILGHMDFDFENFCFFYFLGPKFLAWAHLGPPTWARLGPTHLGPAWVHPCGPGLGLWPGLGLPTWAQFGPTHLGSAGPSGGPGRPSGGPGGPLGWAKKVYTFFRPARPLASQYMDCGHQPMLGSHMLHS